ncbi:phenylacetate--CoA ligase family protein [Methanolobus profundi]|uniref:Phenylacetate-CoA ligase n=1 Tax=Methanolobus profundi TaxID=487685 RepID=A0A1I4PV70_9EURY|nr:AMP-binding protein [Methanolobus profundi]SFM31698.1 phenylacetate-CoA ligase [Methanolobus profundi]
MSLCTKINTSVRMSVAKRKLDSRKINIQQGNPLEQWGLTKIRSDIKNNRVMSNYFGSEEPDRESIKEYKLFKFRELLAYVLDNSPYYQDLYANAGIAISDIRSYEDIEKLPLTEQVDLANKPYHFLCVPRKDIIREFTSSGTTNMLKRMAYTQDELLEIVDSVISGLKMAGMDSKDDVLQIMYPTITATWDPGLVLSKACALGGFNSVIEDSLDAEQQIKTMRESGTTFIIGTSSFLYDLSRQARGLIEPGELGIKRMICSSEPLTEEMREEIESVWGCKTLRQWGMTELGLANAIECDHQNGFHLNNPDFLVEIIDPETGKVLPEGEKGELVVTTLRRKCMPLIRYRTRDITSIIDEPCQCGSCVDQRISDIERWTGN